VDQERTSLQFFNILNFVLEFCAPHPSEKALMARFSRLSIGAGRMLDIQALSPEVRTGAEEGVAEAWQALAVAKEQLKRARSAAESCSAPGRA
jgi:hypothetical protein